MKHKSLFVFDIETVPDTDAAGPLLHTEETDVPTLRQKLEDYHLEVTDGKNSFLRQPFHRVVAISYLRVDIEYVGKEEKYLLKDIKTGGDIESSEEELLRGFFTYLSKLSARLVSFNGRTFDMPVLKYRAMKYGIQANWLYNSGDKWNSYMSRYSLDWHCDLLDALSDFGASARVKLNEVCSILGIPGKIGTDGSKVADLYDNNNIKEIRDYCETDVLNTYLVYLKYMQHNGKLSTDNYNKAIDDIICFIKSKNGKFSHLDEFYKEWECTTEGCFYI